MRRLSVALLASLSLALPAQALDLNGYRAQNGRAALRYDSSLAGLAYFHARSLAARGALDHAGFKTGRGPLGASAENVSFGCNDEACAIQQWARSAPHRANMLRRDVTTYGLGSAVAASGRRYWVMELGGAAPVLRTPRSAKQNKQYLQTATGRL